MQRYLQKIIYRGSGGEKRRGDLGISNGIVLTLLEGIVQYGFKRLQLMANMMHPIWQLLLCF